MRIIDSVLLISVNVLNGGQSRSESQYQDYGENFLLFFRLASFESQLLLNIRRLRNQAFVESRTLEDRTVRLCEYNGNLAVIGTPQLPRKEKRYTLDVWNLVTGQRNKENMIWDSDITAICVSGSDEWSILSCATDLSVRIEYTSIYFYIKTFTAEGDSLSSQLMCVHPLHYDCHINNEWIIKRSHVKFGVKGENPFRWGFVWRDIDYSGGRVRLFEMDREVIAIPPEYRESKTPLHRLFKSYRISAWNRAYVNLSDDYLVAPVPDLETGEKLAYLSLRNGNAKLISKYRESRYPFEVVCEHLIGEKFHYCNSRSIDGISVRSSGPAFESLELYGDEEYFVCRAGESLRLYGFDGCLEAYDDVDTQGITEGEEIDNTQLLIRLHTF